MSDSQFKPHVTMACVVQAENKFLMVEEQINGITTLNQPAGHLEANESILQGAQRELWEETGIKASPQSLLQIYQWIATDGTPFIRFTFAIDLPNIVPTYPHDNNIDCCHWLSADEIINATNLRSPLVRESLLRYLQPERYPLSILESVNLDKKPAS